MKYTVFKTIEKNDTVLFEVQTEAKALKLLNQLIEEYAEELILKYPDINEFEALTIAEECFYVYLENI